MAKINQQPPRAPQWPWGGPRQVRDRLVERSQIDRKAKKKGDPKNPALASAALLDFIGPAHSSEELRLPLPAFPEGHDADLDGYLDRENLSSVAGRGDQDERARLERSLSGVKAPSDRIDRLKALLAREDSMLRLMGQVHLDVEDIQRRRKEEQREEGF
ncbi:MAG: hypothetical protein IPJ65_15835 [Archangiaceae bacterium]|nr:hypothetical protein [Archangiaceae bacterium]